MSSIRDLQVNLPWTIRYSTDFRSSPVAHKDFAHALHHVSKAAGKLHELADDMDHDRTVADGGQVLRETYEKYVADLVVCALRIANTFPGGMIDLERAVIERIESKNAVILKVIGAAHRDSVTSDVNRRCKFCGEPIMLNQAVFEFSSTPDASGKFGIVKVAGEQFIAHVGCGPR